MPADQYIIHAGLAIAREPDRFTQPAANAVADHGAAELLGHRETVTRRPVCAGAFRPQSLQQKPRPRYPGSAGNSKEFGPFPEALHPTPSRPEASCDSQAESRFRPRARRAAMTLRPP